MADVLLDTHAVLWFLRDDARLTKAARRAIMDPATDVFVSAATAWEITTKHRIGKMPEVAAIVTNVEAAVAGEEFLPLDVTMAHAQLAGSLPGDHKDPFDRMIVAQALLEGLIVVSNEAVFDTFGVRRLW